MGADTPKVFDCFCFFREFDVLEIRLQQLEDLVDRFVLVESPWDFAGNPKPLYFDENRDRFSKYSDRITHIVAEGRPSDPDARFSFQHHQRDALSKGVFDARPDDLVMISDVDEIPRKSAMQAAIQHLTHRRAFLVMRMPHHSIRLNLVTPGKVITGPRMVRAKDFRTPHLVRRLKVAYWRGWPDWLDQIPARFNAASACGWPIPRKIIRNAGWHFSSIGNSDLLDDKWRSFNKDERGMSQDTSHVAIGEILSEGRDLEKELGLEAVPIEDLAEPIAENPSRYAHLLAGN